MFWFALLHKYDMFGVGVKKFEKLTNLLDGVVGLFVFYSGI